MSMSSGVVVVTPTSMPSGRRALETSSYFLMSTSNVAAPLMNCRGSALITTPPSPRTRLAPLPPTSSIVDERAFGSVDSSSGLKPCARATRFCSRLWVTAPFSTITTSPSTKAA
eukprot:1246022-Prymnesium_polylepis.1